MGVKFCSGTDGSVFEVKDQGNGEIHRNVDLRSVVLYTGTLHTLKTQHTDFPSPQGGGCPSFHLSSSSIVLCSTFSNQLLSYCRSLDPGVTVSPCHSRDPTSVSVTIYFIFMSG